MKPMSRREAARLVAQSGAGLLLARKGFSAEVSTIDKQPLLERAIPSTGEKLPVIGLGSWQVFDVGPGDAERRPLEDVMARLVGLGGRVVDSSPMYGRSEQVIGEIATKLRLHSSMFLATKVWTTGKEEGIASMESSLARLQTKKLDLMQVHNLVDARTHLATLRAWKEEGRLRYLGITHYNSSGYPEVVRLLRAEKVDFLQINYSLGEREAEREILPLAQDRGVAVLINRPFGGGDLFSRVRQKPLPEWAAEFDCHSWAQFLLKWIVAHSAVTCAIPATSNVRHLEDNMQAGLGRLPDQKQRRRMVETIAQL
ncbi:MAG TPA: aldo/keto reductase [Chthoniobacterales bacterium]|nr:aldo/keto reductase [Chthoniobacterales bacterium]